jgi:uncharacterized protein (DUF1501 family)
MAKLTPPSENRASARAFAGIGDSRRSFFGKVLRIGGGAAVLSVVDPLAWTGLTGEQDPLVRLALAAEGAAVGTNPKVKDRAYLFVYFSGGWDTLLGLDPRDPAQFHAGNLATTLIEPGYAALDDPPNGGKQVLVKGSNGKTIAFGPYIGDLANHIDKVAIVRGMSMDTLTHEVGRRRFLTGKPPSGLLARGSSGGTWLAAMLGQSATIPQISLKVEAYNQDQPNYATALKVGNVPDLLRALNAGNSTLDPKVQALVDLTVATDAACPSRQSSATWVASTAAREKAQQMTSGGLASLFDFQAKTPEMAALRAHYAIGATGAAALATPEAQAALAVTALTAGVSRVVSIQVPLLDAHFDDWATDHGPGQLRGFNLIARVIEDLGKRAHPAGGTHLDHTVIVGFSEFSRTSMLNQRGGRDHALTNACLLAGAGIKGGQVIGRSADVGLAPTKTHLGTGASDDANGEVVKPEHVYRALYWDLGVTADVADMRVEPLKALLSKP